MSNPGLLKKLTDCEYPDDFLVARLRGRQGSLFRNWDFLLSGDNPVEQLHDTIFYPYLKRHAVDGVWRFLHHEHVWVYTRMNRRLRRIFSPYFLYREIDTLFKVLRAGHAAQPGESPSRYLAGSLLADDIQEILTGGQDFSSVLHHLESFLTSLTGTHHRLQDRFEQNGFPALEIYLREILFVHILEQSEKTKLKTFFQLMIDFHNCMALTKNIRWEITAGKVYLKGGTIDQEKLKRTFYAGDPADVLKIFPLTGTADTAVTYSGLEKILLVRISRFLSRQSRQRTAVDEILFYLWEQYRYARNISLVINTMQLGDETIRENIIA